MRFIAWSCLLLLPLAVGSPSWAQESEEVEGNPQNTLERSANLRQQLREEFDADGDGRLNDEERAEARRAMRQRRGRRDDDEAQRGAGGGRGRQRSGQTRGPDGPPDPNRLFNRFDADENGELSRDEFGRVVRAMRVMRARMEAEGRPDRPGMDRDRDSRGRDSDSPRAEGRRGDRPGPPRDGERGRRFSPRGDSEQQADRPRSRGPHGRGSGAEELRPPRPRAIFRRFDENDDQQLSEGEFLKLSEEMRPSGPPRDERAGRGRRSDRPQGDRPQGQRGRRRDQQDADPPRLAEESESNRSSRDSDSEDSN